MSIASKILGLIVGFFTIYSTPKVVQVQNKKIAAFNRIIQLLIFTYVLGYMIIAKKGYQLSSPIESAVITKIKGITRVNLTEHEDELNEKFDKSKLPLYNRVFDGQDIVYPPKESNGFFLTSNLIITKNQSLGHCIDDLNKDSECDPEQAPLQCLDKQSVLSDGRNTGNCVKGSDNKYFCEIEGWCPVEDDTLPFKDKRPIFSEIADFTVLIKNTIRFPLFNILKRNIDETKEAQKEMKNCLFDPIKKPRCPIFKIGDMLKFANVDFNDIASVGGVIAIQINWDCNLDWDLSYCFPTYTFTRLDLNNAKVSPGYNFRYSHYNSINNTETRDLFKAYGIKFEILTSGRGSKFSVVPLALNIGSGVGLLALATLICDFVLLYFTSHKEVYNKKKYLYVKEDVTKGNGIEQS